MRSGGLDFNDFNHFDVMKYNLADIAGSMVVATHSMSDEVCKEYLKHVFPEQEYECLKQVFRQFLNQLLHKEWQGHPSILQIAFKPLSNHHKESHHWLD